MELTKTNIVCVICSELFKSTDIIYDTSCGHIFHSSCVMKWLDRSKTCPHCRCRVTKSMVRRIYFNFSNADASTDDPVSLREKVDNLSLQLHESNAEIKRLNDIENLLKTQISALNEKLKETRQDLNFKHVEIWSLKDQIKFYKQQCTDAENNKKEIARLNKELKGLTNLQILLKGSAEEADELAKQTRDTDALITYISVMKREMAVSFNKRRELVNKYKNSQKTFAEVYKQYNRLLEEHKKCKDLEEQLADCHVQKVSLLAQLQHKKGDISMVTHTPDKCKEVCKEHNSKEESSTKSDIKEKRRKEESNITTPKYAAELDNPASEENTPQGIKSQGFYTMKVPGTKADSSNLKMPSILAKKSKLRYSPHHAASHEMAFDGFGGHTKSGEFYSLPLYTKK